MSAIGVLPNDSLALDDDVCNFTIGAFAKDHLPKKFPIPVTFNGRTKDFD